MIEIKLLNSLIPVYPDKEIDSGEITRLTACKNQPCHFQMAYRLNAEDLKSQDFFIRVESDLPVSTYYINNVPLVHTSHVGTDSLPGLYPDILLPKTTNAPLSEFNWPWKRNVVEDTKEVKLSAFDDCNQAIWFCVNEYSKTVKAGLYKIAIKLYDFEENLICSESLTVDILDLKLPQQKLMYTNWFHHDCLCDLYGVEVFTDEYFEIMKDYVEKAARNGMNMMLLPAFTPALDTGVNCERRTVQLIKVTKTKDGYSFDFSLMKRYIDICKKCGIRYFEHSHFFTQWGAESAPKVMVYKDGKCKKEFGWHTKATGKAYVSFLRQYIVSLKEFLKKEKLDKKIVFHISDEPSDSMAENYNNARKTIIDLLEGYTVCDALSHLELYTKGYCSTPIPITSKVHDFIGKCDDLWTYYTGASSAAELSNRTLTSSRERNRLLGVQLYYYNIKGFLHWAYNNYYAEQSAYLFNPAINPLGGFRMPAAQYMVYPDFNGKCHQSVRQKVFFEGLTDMRLLSLLEKLSGRTVCNQLIEKHFGKIRFDKAIDSPEVYTNFMDDLYKCIKENSFK